MVKRKILIVDDEVHFTNLLRLNLELTGRFQVEEVNDGKEVLKRAKIFRPDLILLDVIMPEVDGSEVASSLKLDKDLKGVPIVFLTAIVSRQEVGPQEKKIGGNVFLAKPVTPEKVIECIDKILERPQTKKEM